jgi:hypothetical protein
MQKGKGVLGFLIWLQESKYVFVFSDLINVEYRSARKSVWKVLLIIKIGPGSWVHFSSLSKKCGGIKRKIDDRNNDTNL